jgi:hypothetical protein
LVDLDGDGRLDILSGSWPGELYLFRGGPGHTFAPGETLKDRRGSAIKVGSASAVHAADWDRDGDLDLLIGNIAGEVHFVRNEGSARSYEFGTAHKLEADGTPIGVPHGDAGPFVADWDDDGKLDLLVGTGAGSVLWYRNTGSGKEPSLQAARTLVPDSAEARGARATRGTRAKVCATDWNGDGRLDLLVGDFAIEQAPRPEPANNKDENDAQAKARKELDDLLSEHRRLQRPGKKGETAREREAREEKLRSVGTKIVALIRHSSRGEGNPSEYHGRVWLSLRKPAEVRGS